MTLLNMTVSPLNATPEPGALGGAAGPERELEAYSVVLSMTSHLVALVVGGSSNLALFVAMCARRRGGTGSNLSARGYSQVLSLVGACLLLCLVWSPLEAADLLAFHHTGRHAFRSQLTLAVKTSLHLFLLTLVCAVIFLLAVEAALRLVGSTRRCGDGSDTPSFRIPSHWCAAGHGKSLWPPMASMISLLVATILAALYLATRARPPHQQSYVDTEPTPRALVLALTVVAFSCTLLAGLVLLVLLLRDRIYWEDGRPHLKKRSKAKLIIPDFLISQANAAAENTGRFDPSTATPSPSTPKLLAVVGCEPGAGGDEVSPISDLPPAAAANNKSLGSRLGVNMAQVLGRRRHTICQIGDSSSGGSGTGAGLLGSAGGGPGNDPSGKAKQYNYVRKFSVDISALQAQLQNPKIFKEAPFQSDVDLTKKPNGEGGPGGQKQPEPLLPLKPLPKRFEKLGEGGKGSEAAKGEGGGSLGLGNLATVGPAAQKGTPPPVLKNGPTTKPGVVVTGAPSDVHPVHTPPQPPPPVIMVSNDEDQPDQNEDDGGVVSINNKEAFQTQDDDENTPLNPDGNTNTIGGIEPAFSPSQPGDNGIITASPAAKKPTTLTFKDSSSHPAAPCRTGAGEEENGENHMTPQVTLDSCDFSDASADGDDDGEGATAARMSKLVLLLCSCYLLALLPVVLTELLRGTLTARAYVNTRACVVAVWALQTLVYPHLLTWGDRNLHRAVQRLKRRLATAGTACCPCCCESSSEQRNRPGEDTSSTSQV